MTTRSLPVTLLRAREAVMEDFRPLLAAHGVTEQQWRVLRVLQEAGETDATKLARGAALMGPSLSRIMRTLESAGLIVARKDPEDGRRTLMRLTPAGHDLIDRVAPSSAAIYARIEARVGHARTEELLNNLNFLIEALSGPDR